MMSPPAAWALRLRSSVPMAAAEAATVEVLRKSRRVIGWGREFSFFIFVFLYSFAANRGLFLHPLGLVARHRRAQGNANARNDYWKPTVE
jgi:hypothetical protein